MARAGEGKRGGYRTIIAYQKGKRAVFVYGFAKSDQGNLSPKDLQAYQQLAQIYSRFSETDIATALQGGELQEVESDEEEISE